jgi:putative transposase
MGLRRRNRLIDEAALRQHLGGPSREGFGEMVAMQIDDAIRRDELRRDAKWTESIAVGSESYAQKIGRQIDQRMKLDIRPDNAKASSWVVRESADTVYG